MLGSAILEYVHVPVPVPLPVHPSGDARTRSRSTAPTPRTRTHARLTRTERRAQIQAFQGSIETSSMFPASEYIALQLQLILLPSAGPAAQRRCLVMAPLATALRDRPDAAKGLGMGSSPDPIQFMSGS